MYIYMYMIYKERESALVHRSHIPLYNIYVYIYMYVYMYIYI